MFFDCARHMFRLCLTHNSVKHDLGFDCADPGFDYARTLFRLCSTYVSTRLGLCFSIVLDICFVCA